MKYSILSAFVFILFSATNLQAQVSLSGQFTNTYGDEIGDISINLLDSNGDLISSQTIGCDGLYSITGLDAGVAYQLEIDKSGNPLNGLSTFDLVLVSKHILGVQSLGVHETFAADINNSGSVTVMDLLLQRRLILNIIQEFPDNLPGWLFFEGDNEVPASVFPIQISEDTSDYNFIGVKRGDVNGSAATCE